MHSATSLTLTNPGLHGAKVGGVGVRGGNVSVDKMRFTKVSRFSLPRSCSPTPL